MTTAAITINGIQAYLRVASVASCLTIGTARSPPLQSRMHNSSFGFVEQKALQLLIL